MTESPTKRENSEDPTKDPQEDNPKKQKTEEDSVKYTSDETEADQKENGDSKDLATLFPSLKPLLDSTNVPILALYFAAAWCPDCRESGPFVTDIFKAQNQESRLFDLIYVSSDKDVTQMDGNIDEGWGKIPFENEEERANIKRYFGVCAAKEVESLGMKPEDRKSGIPTLILLNKKTKSTIMADAIPDILGESKVEDPIKKWESMLPSDS